MSRIDPKNVPQLVERLASFLRFRLESTNSPFRTLIDESDALQAYLDIEKVRYGDQLQVVFETDKETYRWEVPDCILKPLVENAIKHGFQEDQVVELTVCSRLHAGRLQLEVTNACPERSKESSADGFGIGLPNTRSRLGCLYGTNASVEFNRLGSRYTASLCIPSKELSKWKR